MRRYRGPDQRLRTPEGLLKQDWRALPPDKLRAYLVRILTNELHAYPQWSRRQRSKPKNAHLRYRLRHRRKEVVMHYLRQGGRVSSLAKRHALPFGKAWPGVVAIVWTRGYETAFVP